MSTTTTLAGSAAVTSGLEAYSGSWGRAQAAHLLRRTLFGPTRGEIADATAAGLSATLDQLMGPPPVPPPPVNHYFTDDPKVPVGSPWVNASFDPDVDVGQYRYHSLRGWYWQHLLHHETHLMSRMTMFWIHFFGMADKGDHRAEYDMINLFDTNGLGNYKEMIERITVHPTMLVFLNGNDNTRYAPDENYARELMEKFTLTPGPTVAEGDYTTYTEQDVQQMARALTGWRIRGMWSDSEDVVESYFAEWAHEVAPPENPKQLSHRFGNAIIANDGPNETQQIIDLIFAKPETGLAFCRALYRYFVFHEIDDAVESQVIVPMAALLRANDFAIAPALRALLGSQHFYDIAVRGPMIKNPYEFIVSMVRPLGGYRHLGMDLTSPGGESLRTRYQLGSSHHWWGYNLEMDFLTPPMVGGWKAYYQAPEFYRTWIGSATLKERKSIADAYGGWGIWTQTDDGDYDPRPLDFFGFVATLDDPGDANLLVAQSVATFLPRELHPDQLARLKNELIPDLPDEEWRRQYSDYLANPFNPDVVNPVRNKLRNFYRALFNLAEFHLM